MHQLQPQLILLLLHLWGGTASNLVCGSTRVKESELVKRFLTPTLFKKTSWLKVENMSTLAGFSLVGDWVNPPFVTLSPSITTLPHKKFPENNMENNSLLLKISSPPLLDNLPGKTLIGNLISSDAGMKEKWQSRHGNVRGSYFQEDVLYYTGEGDGLPST